MVENDRNWRTMLEICGKRLEIDETSGENDGKWLKNDQKLVENGER